MNFRSESSDLLGCGLVDLLEYGQVDLLGAVSPPLLNHEKVRCSESTWICCQETSIHSAHTRQPPSNCERPPFPHPQPPTAHSKKPHRLSSQNPCFIQRRPRVNSDQSLQSNKRNNGAWSGNYETQKHRGHSEVDHAVQVCDVSTLIESCFQNVRSSFLPNIEKTASYVRINSPYTAFMFMFDANVSYEIQDLRKWTTTNWGRKVRFRKQTAIKR